MLTAEWTEKQVEALRSRQEEVKKTIITQYTRCTRLLTELFSYTPDTCWKEDGKGCCDQDLATAEAGLCGPAEGRLIELRNAKRAEAGLRLGVACLYHAEGEGCILGELKAPLCMATECMTKVPEGYDYRRVRRTLEWILTGLDPQTREVNPSANQPLVDEFAAYVQRLIDEVKPQNSVARSSLLEPIAT